MKNKYLRIYVSAILLTFSSVFISCKQEVKFQQVEHLNTHHLDHLYEKIKVNDIDMAIVHIYADYPDYNYVDDEDEGMACVDDAARAALFYLDLYKSNPKEEYLNKHKYLTEFLMYMQADNGYFYNFIWNDYTINRDHKNSLPQPDWWSWRALWALTESHGKIGR
jgi:hypothetical protein